MPKSIVTVAAAAVLALVAATAPIQAQAIPADLVTKPTPHSVKDTLDRLTVALAAKGITPVARIDHAAGAQKVGQTLAPTEVILFGNPALGTPIIQASRTAGLDLPMKVLAWTDAKGKTFVAYQRPTALARRHGIKKPGEAIQKMTAALEGFIAEAIKP